MAGAVAKHWAVLRSAWSLDADAARSRRRYTHTEFLPASLEVIETPASPIGRAVLWLLVGGVAAALLWAAVGRLDVVVTAPGKIIVADQVKHVQSSELGVLRAIHVVDGQRVRKGQLLIELDPTVATADDSQARTGLLAAEVDSARSRAILTYLREGRTVFVPPAGIPAQIVQIQRDLVTTQIQEYESRRAILLRERGEHRSELAAAEAERAKLRETLPLLDLQIEARRKLVEQGHFPKLRLYELQEERIERAHNLDVQAAAAGKANSAIAGIDAQLTQLRSELARSTVKDLAMAQDNGNLRQSEISKTRLRNSLMGLRSPVDGTVQQLAVHTLGGVVQPAEVLLVVVPAHGQLVVDAKIASSDIGFVRPGQAVRLKIEAFPFNDYGIVDGRLESISQDAVEDEKLGLFYSARVALLDASQAARRGMNLHAGMTVAAEVKTAKRSILSYLLSPIWTRLDEAAREQ